jgi:hypothetical protein
LKLDTLRRALARAARLYDTSQTTPAADAADDLEIGRCRTCNGHVFIAHPARGSLYLGPVEILNDGGCPECRSLVDVWSVLDLALSPTAPRLRACLRPDLFSAYGVSPYTVRPLVGAASNVAPDPRRKIKES